MSVASITVNAHVRDTTLIDQVEFPALPDGRREFVSIEIGAVSARVLLMVSDAADVDRLIEVCQAARRFLIKEAARRAADAVQPRLIGDDVEARAS